MKRLGLLGLLLLLAGCGKEEALPIPEQLPAVQASLSNPTPRVGDRVLVDVLVTSTNRLVLPPWDEWLHPAVELIERESPDLPVLRDDLWQRRERLTVSLFAVTNVPLFAERNVRTLDAPPVVLELPFLAFEVQSVLTGTNDVPSLGNLDLPDFRGPEALRRFRRNILISLGALAVLLAFLAWLAWGRKTPAPAPPPPRWDLLALRALADLRATEAWTLPDVDAAATALSLILREYIEGQFGIHAPERTTEEFLEEARALRPWLPEQHAELETFFDIADRIKYAAARPGRDVLEELAASVDLFVRVTRPEQGGGA